MWKIIATRAADYRSSVQEAIDREVQSLRFADGVIKRAQERLDAGEIQPTFRDGIAASRLLSKYDHVVIERDQLRDQLKWTENNLQKLFRFFSGAASDEEWCSLGTRIQADPEMRVLWPPFWR